MSWDVALAREIKKRDHQEYIGVIVGIVIEVNPLKISIYNGNAIFTDNNLYVCKLIDNYINTGNLTINDRVACIATQDNQKLFVIDRLS